MLTALLDHTARTLRDNPDTTLNPYLTDHLAEHASAVGAPGWQMLVAQPDVLERLPPARVAGEVMRIGFGQYQIPAPILAVVAAAHILTTSAPADRRGVLDLSLARQGIHQPATATNPTPGGPDSHTRHWRVPAAALSRQTVHRTLTGHTGGVTGVAAFTAPDGRVLLATTSHDQTVRIWDPVARSAGR